MIEGDKMSSIDKIFLRDTILNMERVYMSNCDKTVLSEKNKCKFNKKYSKNQVETNNQCLTSYIRLNQYKIPRIFNAPKPKNLNYTEYYFDDSDFLKEKIVHYNSESKYTIEYYYVYGLDFKLRLGFKGNILREIHSCKFQNDILMRIDNAYFSQFGEMTILSGDIYEYSNYKLSSCLKYSDYSPLYPMFIKKMIMDTSIILNPSIEEFKLIYDNNGELKQYTMFSSKNPINVSKNISHYFKILNDGNNIDPIVLW